MRAKIAHNVCWTSLIKCKREIGFDCFSLHRNFDFSRDKSPKAEAPSFLKKIGDIEVYEGMKARFTACATGWPEPEVEWFLNGDRIYPNERTQVEAEPNGK